MTFRQAQARRHDFYRFGKAIDEGALRGEDLAKHYQRIFRRVTFSIDPTRAAPADPAILRIEVNALEQVLSAVSAARTPQKPKPAVVDKLLEQPNDPLDKEAQELARRLRERLLKG